MTAKAKAAEAATELVATTGLDYQDAGGTFQRIEAGDRVQASDVSKAALDWMTRAGFLVAPQPDGED